MLVATAADRVEAVARVRTDPFAPIHLQALGAASPAAAAALIAGVRALHPGLTLVVGERAGLAVRELLGAVTPVARRNWLYARIADPAVLLGRLRPVLDARLAASPFATSEGRVDISFYRSGVSIEYGGGRVTDVTASGRDGSGGPPSDVHLPPDLLPRLLFGPGNVLDWENDPDVDLGARRDLLAVLLPPLLSDVLIW